MKPKILVIVGPTASGKSDLAVRLAKKFNGEVVSADSRQVYKGLNIGTGKITKNEMKGVRHHLLNVADPKKRFTVIDYKKLADEAIYNIAKRGKLPIICGGTGFYIDAVVDDRDFPAAKVDKKLRAKLATKSSGQLLAMLVKLDPTRAKTLAASNSERQNSRRLIRAIEVAMSAQPTDEIKKYEGRTITIQSVEWPTSGSSTNIIRCAKRPPCSNYDAIWIGIKVPPIALRARIRKRLVKRLKGGMLTEAKLLHKPRTRDNPNGGLSWKRMEDLGLEYRYEAEYLQGKSTREQFIEVLSNKIWQYARRQMTWFRRNGKIKWFTRDQNLKIEKKVRRILSS